MRHRLALLLIAVLCCAFAPLSLAAQFRVPRPKVPNPLDRITQSASSNTRTPTFDDRVLELNDARLASLVRGLRAEQQQRPALEAAYKKNADDRAAAEVATRRQVERGTSAQSCLVNSPEYRAIYGDTANQRKTDERLRKARDRGDERAAKAIEDSVMNAMMNIDPNTAMGLVTAQQRCGMASPATVMPTAIPAPAAPPRIRIADSLRVIGTGASGLTDDQYSIMRERVLAYLTTDEADLRNSMYVFSGKELTALRAKRSELERYQTMLVEG